jgi:hypothetical protein
VTVSISLDVVEEALKAMREAILGADAPAGGWVPGIQDQGTVRWPYVDLEFQWSGPEGTANGTLTETVHATTRGEAVTIAAKISTALNRRSYAGTGVQIIGHELLTSPELHRRMESTTAKLTWRVVIGWKP